MERDIARYKSTHPKVVVSDTGFSIVDQQKSDFLAFEKVSEIAVYKMDQFFVDLVCCEIAVDCEGGAKFWTVHEDMHGFDVLMARFESWPGCYLQWREVVILPAFAKNFTVIYRRGVDLNLIYSEDPPKHPVADSSNEPRSNKWKWRIICAVIVLVPLCFVLADWFKADRCLDQGGRYDREYHICRFSER